MKRETLYKVQRVINKNNETITPKLNLTMNKKNFIVNCYCKSLVD